ncbi:unnamed protein product [Prunus brigantina]
MTFTIDTEVFGADRNTFILPEDITQFAGMEEIGATVVAVYMSRHWVLLIVRAKRETVYFLDPLPGNRVFAKGKEEAPYPQEAIDEVRNEWAEFVCLHME